MGVMSGEPGWREVLLLAAAVVVGVLALQVVTQSVPQLGDVLGRYPVVVLVLVTGTAIVVVAALRSRQRR